jgi:hypothetical protein
MYMLIPEIYSEHASLLYVWRVLPTLAHIPFVCMKRSSLVTIVKTRFETNTRLICCLPLNTVDEFLVSRSIDAKRVECKDLTLLWIYHC